MKTLLMTMSLFSVLLALGFVHDQDAIRDQFSLKDRAAGLRLDKAATEVGGGLWAATGNVVFGGTGDAGYVALTNAAPFTGRVALPAAAKTIKIEADIRAVSAGAKSNWIAIGIGNPVLGCPSWGSGVFFFVDSAGYYGCSGSADPPNAND